MTNHETYVFCDDGIYAEREDGSWEKVSTTVRFDTTPRTIRDHELAPIVRAGHGERPSWLVEELACSCGRTFLSNVEARVHVGEHAYWALGDPQADTMVEGT